MNISVMLPALIIPLMMVIPQLAENGPLLSKAWTWHLYHPESAPGMGRVSEHREMDAPRRSRGSGEAKVNEAGGYSLGAAGATALPRRLQGYRKPHPSVCLLCLSLLGHLTGLLAVLTLQGLDCRGTCSNCGTASGWLQAQSLHRSPPLASRSAWFVHFSTPALFQTLPALSLLICETLALIGRCALVVAALEPPAVVSGREDCLLSGSVPLFLVWTQKEFACDQSHNDFGEHGLKRFSSQGAVDYFCHLKLWIFISYRGSTDFEPGVVAIEC